ncbi:hypothetical protein [Hydrogenophaga sp.]|uniref:hypothetical protein n=1 Tax=Hydrogenophaga sp. TaxID=1904254 RepID=UPI002731952C|nr:hypothetical protein [Hydrogenophaga sp.]MDP2016662.1 hypothetical protein [Hydrogenophaga sp.]MDP3167390.1 hypothetical protein [Hydrogenophaga sp.]
MRTSASPIQRIQALRSSAPAQPLLRTEIRAATRHDITPSQAQGLLLQALDELQLIPIDDADTQLPGRFHESFVQILHIARAQHHTVEETVLEHMSHALRVHYANHDRVAHALVSAWTCVVPRDPVKLVVQLIDILASEAAPLPFWLSHVLQLLPLSGQSLELPNAQRQARELLRTRLDELTPAHVAKRLQRLEQDPDPRGLEQLIGDLGLLALEQSPTAGLARMVEMPPGDDEALVWFSHQHPALVCVGNMACDDHWLLTPLGHATLERVLHLCTFLEAGAAHRLRRQMFYQYTHAARLPLLRPSRRHPCLVLAQIHRIVQTLDKGADAWADVLEWLAPQRSGHHGHPSSPSPQHTVFDLLLLPSFELSPLLALHSMLDARVDPTVWLPGVVRSCMATQPGLSRLLRPLHHLHATAHLNHCLVSEVWNQCPPAHLMRVGFEMGLTVFNEPSKLKGLTRDGLHALARAQARFGPGWVPFSLLAHLLDEGKRFGCVGLGASDGDWLLAFAQENGLKLKPGMPAAALEEALKNLFDVLTHLGQEAEPVSHVCMHLLDQLAGQTPAKA